MLLLLLLLFFLLLLMVIYSLKCSYLFYEFHWVSPHDIIDLYSTTISPNIPGGILYLIKPDHTPTTTYWFMSE